MVNTVAAHRRARRRRWRRRRPFLLLLRRRRRRRRRRLPFLLRWCHECWLLYRSWQREMDVARQPARELPWREACDAHGDRCWIGPWRWGWRNVLRGAARAYAVPELAGGGTSAAGTSMASCPDPARHPTAEDDGGHTADEQQHGHASKNACEHKEVVGLQHADEIERRFDAIPRQRRRRRLGWHTRRL